MAKRVFIGSILRNSLVSVVLMDFQKMNKPGQTFLQSLEQNRQLAILIDPDKFDPATASQFLDRIPEDTTQLFVGGSEVAHGETEKLVITLKTLTDLPVVLFPGDHSQLCPQADSVLFLSLYSGNNPEYLIGQQRKAVAFLKAAELEVVPTAYLLIDGGHSSAVARVTKTEPLSQNKSGQIVEVALAAQYCGARCIYLEAGSGAQIPVDPKVISAVKEAVNLPLIVGGGIRSEAQKEAAYLAGANLVVMGTTFEN